MDSDDEDNRLRIVEADESGVLNKNSLVKQEPVDELTDPFPKQYHSEDKQKSSFAPLKEEQFHGQTRRSRLPDSLKKRVVRSNARGNVMIAPASTTIMPNNTNRASKADQLPKLSHKQIVKKELDLESQIATSGQITVHRDIPVKLENEATGNHSAAQLFKGGNTISGRRREFAHPCLNKMDRVVQIIEPTDLVLKTRLKNKKSSRRMRISQNSKEARNDEAADRKAWTTCDKLIKEELDTSLVTCKDEQHDTPSKENQFLAEIMAGMDWDDSKVKKGEKRAHSYKGAKRRAKTSASDGTKASVKIQHTYKRKEDAKLRKASPKLASGRCTQGIELKQEPDEPENHGDSLRRMEMDLEEIGSKLSRAKRRKLTRSLLLECNAKLTRPKRKKPTSACPRKGTPRIVSNVDVEIHGEESFDTFLNYPMGGALPETFEGLFSEPNEHMKRLYEDYMTNVRGQGVPVDDLLLRLTERRDALKKKVEMLEKENLMLEKEDNFGADPFLDHTAYRMHPLMTRGERRRWFALHPKQLQNNSCALSELSSGMWCVNSPQYLPIFREKREYDDVSARLDELSGRVSKSDDYLNSEYMEIIRRKIRAWRVHAAQLRQRSKFAPRKELMLNHVVKTEPIEEDDLFGGVSFEEFNSLWSTFD